MKSRSILGAIGKTPLVQLGTMVPPGSADVFVKLEYFNPTGSYKDRVALAMIEMAEERGDLRPGMTVVEYTAGSTGSALAMVCAMKGYRLKVVSSDVFAREKLQTMRAFGAELTLVPSPNGKVTPELLTSMMETAQALAQADDVYFTNQRNNPDIIKGHGSIGRELLAQMDRPIDVFCAAAGTSGMVMGTGKVLREANSPTRIVVLEPAASPVISGGEPGAHRVEGVGFGKIPPLLNDAYYDEARAVDETEAREIARRLPKDEGIFAGISSGMNVAGALTLAQELGPGQTVVTVAVDTGFKYLAGDLYPE